MRKNFRNDLIQLFSTSARASSRTKAGFEMLQLPDPGEPCKRSADTTLKWKLMHRAKQRAMFGCQFVKTLRLSAMRRHRLFNENMNPAAERGRGYREMSAQWRADMKHINLLVLQRVF